MLYFSRKSILNSQCDLDMHRHRTKIIMEERHIKSSSAKFGQIPASS